MTRAYPLGMVDRPAATILGPSVPCESGRLALLPKSHISDIVRSVASSLLNSSFRLRRGIELRTMS
jgi:hypothetical protein